MASDTLILRPDHLLKAPLATIRGCAEDSLSGSRLLVETRDFFGTRVQRRSHLRARLDRYGNPLASINPLGANQQSISSLAHANSPLRSADDMTSSDEDSDAFQAPIPSARRRRPLLPANNNAALTVKKRKTSSQQALTTKKKTISQLTRCQAPHSNAPHSDAQLPPSEPMTLRENSSLHGTRQEKQSVPCRAECDLRRAEPGAEQQICRRQQSPTEELLPASETCIEMRKGFDAIGAVDPTQLYPIPGDSCGLALCATDPAEVHFKTIWGGLSGESLANGQEVLSPQPNSGKICRAFGDNLASPPKQLITNDWRGEQAPLTPEPFKGPHAEVTEAAIRPAAPLCPICGLRLADLAETETGQQAHVNGCLDRQLARSPGSSDPHGACEAHGASVDLTGGPAMTSDCPAAHPAVFEQGREQSPSPDPAIQPAQGDEESQGSKPIAAWLASLGLHMYTELFENEEVDLEVVQHLSMSDLQDLGVTSHAIRETIHEAAALLQSNGTGLLVETAAVGKTPALVHETACGTRLRDAKEFFRCLGQAPAPGPRQTVASTQVRGVAGPAASTSGRSGQPARSAGRGGWSRGGGSTTQRAVRDPAQDHRRVAGTSFIVDGFTGDLACAPCTHWFLTHFHSDHYQGLGRSFKRGKIYCTPVTAALVVQELKVHPSKICQIPISQPTEVEGVLVTFLEANHCPGAAMILFEPRDAQPVLHTGDFRACPAMQEYPALKAVQGRVRLVSDATYAASDYDFPPQEDTIRFVVDAIRSESFNSKTLFMIGTYKIGKERLFLEAASRLQKKVYVSETKLQVLRCLNLPPEHMKWLTTDDRETNLHVVPMNKVTVNGVKSAVKWYRGQFQTIVTFKPTGWSMQRGKGHCAAGRRKKRGTVVSYQVPYSEHSSFKELQSFVRWLKPTAIQLHSFSGPCQDDCIQQLRGQP